MKVWPAVGAERLKVLLMSRSQNKPSSEKAAWQILELRRKQRKQAGTNCCQPWSLYLYGFICISMFIFIGSTQIWVITARLMSLWKQIWSGSVIVVCSSLHHKMAVWCCGHWREKVRTICDAHPPFFTVFEFNLKMLLSFIFLADNQRRRFTRWKTQRCAEH